MIKKKLSKLIGLKKNDFDAFVISGQIQLQPARLIPVKKTGDEAALTSIFLSSLKLVKEYRDSVLKDIGLSRAGRLFYYIEATFPEIDNSRVDGLVIVVIKGIIKEAAIFEMKNKSNSVNKNQVERYINLAKLLRVKTMVTISNEFVADPSHSPVDVWVPKNISLFHFSWTYLLTRGHLLLFKNEHTIKDVDQIEIMREALAYFEAPESGVRGYIQMKPGWKELSENVRAQKSLKVSDAYIKDAIVSWYEEEKDIALLLSRKLGIFVKSSTRSKDSMKQDIKLLVNENYISGSLGIKNSVSDIKIITEFERRMVILSIRVNPPQNKGAVGKIAWINRQLDNSRKKSLVPFEWLFANLYIEANIKYAREHIKVKLSDLETLNDLTRGKDIISFHLVVMKPFGANFASLKKFIILIEELVLNYYEGIVQHMTNWVQPAPKLTIKE